MYAHSKFSKKLVLIFFNPRNFSSVPESIAGGFTGQQCSPQFLSTITLNLQCPKSPEKVTLQLGAMNRFILGSPPPAMAYLLSVTFSMPLRHRQILFQTKCWRGGAEL